MSVLGQNRYVVNKGYRGCVFVSAHILKVKSRRTYFLDIPIFFCLIIMLVSTTWLCCVDLLPLVYMIISNFAFISLPTCRKLQSSSVEENYSDRRRSISITNRSQGSYRKTSNKDDKDENDPKQTFF